MQYEEIKTFYITINYYEISVYYWNILIYSLKKYDSKYKYIEKHHINFFCIIINVHKLYVYCEEINKTKALTLWIGCPPEKKNELHPKLLVVKFHYFFYL